MEFSPSNGTGSFAAQTEQSFMTLGPNPDFLQIDSVIFQRRVGEDVFQLTLSMIEPAGFFRGGVVLEAVDTDTSFGVPQSQTSMSDLFGTGLVVDPAILAPEPGCGLLLAAGLCLIAAGRRRRSK
jgi:MYXO-CTERM domain-containing protein